MSLLRSLNSKRKGERKEPCLEVVLTINSFMYRSGGQWKRPPSRSRCCGQLAGLTKGAPFTRKDGRSQPNYTPRCRTWRWFPRIIMKWNLPRHPVSGCWRVGTGPRWSAESVQSGGVSAHSRPDSRRHCFNSDLLPAPSDRSPFNPTQMMIYALTVPAP